MVDFMIFLPVHRTVMISIWFSYGLGLCHFFLMKFVMAGSIFFTKTQNLKLYFCNCNCFSFESIFPNSSYN